MEADGLRWSLLVIGSLVIVGLAVHGIWLSRKNSENKNQTNKQQSDQEYQPSGWQSDDKNFDESKDVNDHMSAGADINFDMKIDDDLPDVSELTPITDEFDDLGLGAVRVVSREPKVEAETPIETIADTEIPTEPMQEPEPKPEPSSSKIYASVVTQPKPEYAAKYNSLAAETVAISQQEKAKTSAQQPSTLQSTTELSSSATENDEYQAPEPPPFLLKKDTTNPDNLNKQVDIASAANTTPVVEKPHVTLAEKLSLSEQARNLVKRKKADTVRKRREPKITEDQMRIDFDEQPVVESMPKEEVKQQATTKTEAEQLQEVLVLNVKSAEDNPIPGAALLPMLLTLGFKFGDQDIFHRHVNSNGKGPVLFSLANMFKPGNFDIDNLENFTTQGISLFMILPIEGDPHQVFNMMHNAARKIAEEFSAQIYDGSRVALTKQSLQLYVEKIREFERQRLIKG
ncbi:cell division protein ZipA [uncultured Paraglaciecola sp.]|uniref:cell division protein ZipA n=1 Tax=uncultured Paraglaciecola sp. TaxID=1765024 RepID=UPI00262DB364|nr:cell division protein ZipA [uncultured Paraglaciecola sp.]